MSVEALLHEREGYVRRGLTNRVAQVDAALAKLGFGVQEPSEVETVTVRKGKERNS